MATQTERPNAHSQILLICTGPGGGVLSAEEVAASYGYDNQDAWK
ncbi:MAG: hypothetical protein AAB518_01330 [Patescibacteria group bacterium]